MTKTVGYFLSPQSPWCYLGHQRLVELVRDTGAQVELKPFDLGKVFSVSGGVPLAKRAPQRQAYRLVEIERWAKFLGLPINPQPQFFPVSTDAASALIIAARTSLGVDAALALSGAIMRALWAEEKNIADEDTLAQIADLCG
ncbi:MAG TPA: DsbA family protein, partial [Telluria sp.]